MKRPNSASLIVFGFSLGLFATAHAGTMGSTVFPDVPNGTYYDSAVGDMYAAGIITGYSDGKFGPNDYVTRGQVAVMMQRFKAHLTGQSIAVSSSSSSRNRTTTSSSSSTSSSEESSSVATTNTDEGSFRFTTGSYKADETDGSVTINLIRYGGNNGAVTIEYETENGTADDGSDYDLAEGKIVFADGKTSGSFTVPILDDNEVEGNETVTLRIKNPTGGAELGSPIVATLTIVDDDTGDGTQEDISNPKGVFSLSAGQYKVAENGDEITVTVERVGTTGAVSVAYATSNGTADSSYYDTKSGTLNFSDGESAKTFTITIKDNDSTNGNKTVDLKLSNPTGGATLGNLSTAQLIIIDNEVSSFTNGSFELEDDEYDTSEGDSVVVQINRIGGADGDVELDYETVNSLAKSGDDYTERTGTLLFREGESQKFITIPILTDSNNDPRETFWFKISNPTGGATLDDITQATITIQ